MFSSSPLSKYWRGSTLLNYGDRSTFEWFDCKRREHRRWRWDILGWKAVKMISLLMKKDKMRLGSMISSKMTKTSPNMDVNEDEITFEGEGQDESVDDDDDIVEQFISLTGISHWNHQGSSHKTWESIASLQCLFSGTRSKLEALKFVRKLTRINTLIRLQTIKFGFMATFCWPSSVQMGYGLFWFQ